MFFMGNLTARFALQCFYQTSDNEIRLPAPVFLLCSGCVFVYACVNVFVHLCISMGLCPKGECRDPSLVCLYPR